MNMRDFEIYDLALTQAIDQYLEMEPDEAYRAILRDWPDQTATLLLWFFFGDAGERHFQQVRSIYARRRQGADDVMTYFYARVLDLPFFP